MYKKNSIKFIFEDKWTNGIFLYTLGRGVFPIDPPKPLYFLCNSFSLWLREKSSQTKTFSRKVFFMFCLKHFSLKCIIILFYFRVNDPLKYPDLYQHRNCRNKNRYRVSSTYIVARMASVSWCFTVFYKCFMMFH